MTYEQMRTWARECSAGDYLVTHDRSVSDHTDPGSRCGLSDPDLDQIARWLAARGLRLLADDRGLRACAWGRP